MLRTLWNLASTGLTIWTIMGKIESAKKLSDELSTNKALNENFNLDSVQKSLVSAADSQLHQITQGL